LQALSTEGIACNLELLRILPSMAEHGIEAMPSSLRRTSRVGNRSPTFF